MNIALQELPVEERIKMVEDIWGSIAADQKAELDRRLNAYEVDGNRGRLVTEVMADIRRKL
ncbi:MAG TPA: addiction module protein [Gallionella sp.]|nr:addiction module protein [Gallionella sp.]